MKTLLFAIILFSLALPGSLEAAFKQDTPNSCIGCHKNLDDPRLSSPVALWADSVHGEVGNTCDGCHGGDPEINSEESMSEENQFYAAPKEEEIIDYCGKCHRELADNFKKSLHAETGTQNCIGCHGSHTIRRISIDIINPETCSECHDYEEAEKLKNLLQSLHNQFHKSKNKIQLITGFSIRHIESDLKTNWNKLRKIRMLSHRFDIPTLTKEADPVFGSIQKTDEEIDRILSMSKSRKLWGWGSIILFSLLALTTYFYNKSSQKQDQGGND